MEAYILETDLEKIKALSLIREDENERFRQFLKNRNDDKTDALVHRLNEVISARIDCTACGNCCKELSPTLSKGDLKQIAEATRKSVEEVIAAYTERDAEGDTSFRHMPCCFLAHNKCTIYQHRPEVCHSFPHLHKPAFSSRLRSAINNYAICPIVFNVIERMKKEMGFK
jgi:Fe-S-cluster containining protein